MRSRILTALILATAGTALAEDATFVVYHQGRLLTSDDTPLEGVQTITVSLFTSETADVASWTQAYETIVSKGVYGIAIGDTKGQRKPLTAADFAGERWLAITFGGNEFKPRMRVGSAPLAFVAQNANALGGAPAADYLKKADFDAFKTALTGGGSGGGLTVSFTKITDIPADFGAGLKEVTTVGTTLTGTGAATKPLKVADAGIDTAQLKDGAVTAAKMGPNGCTDGQLLKFQSGSWQCSSDIGGGSTLPFDVLAPLEQVAGGSGSAAKIQLKDGGILTVKLADNAVTSAKLAADPLSLGKLSGGAFTTTTGGAVGIGTGTPTARLEVADFPTTGIDGVGSVTYTSGATTVALSGGSFTDQVRPGDSIQLGALGFRTITAVTSATALSIDSAYTSGWGGTWTYRRATLRAGQILQTATGNIGIGTVPTLFKLDVAGDVNASGQVRQGGAPLVPAGAVMYFAIANCPTGWVKANGQTLNTSAFPNLAAAFGVTAATFAVPDLRGQFVRSLDDGRGVDPGRGLNSAQGEDWHSVRFQNTGGPSSAYNHNLNTAPKDGSVSGRAFGGLWQAPGGEISMGFDMAGETRPKNVALLACIKG